MNHGQWLSLTASALIVVLTAAPVMADSYDALFPRAPEGWTTSPASSTVTESQGSQAGFAGIGYKGRRVTRVAKSYEHRDPYARIEIRTVSGAFSACTFIPGSAEMLGHDQAPNTRTITFKGYEGELVSNQRGGLQKLELKLADCNVLTVNGENISEETAGWFLDQTDIDALANL